MNSKERDDLVEVAAALAVLLWTLIKMLAIDLALSFCLMVALHTAFHSTVGFYGAFCVTIVLSTIVAFNSRYKK